MDCIGQTKEQHIEDVDPALKAGETFLCALFAESDSILFRPIETWVEGGKKCSRVDYRNTCYCRGSPGSFQSALLPLLRCADQERLNLFFAVCPRSGNSGRYDLGIKAQTLATWATTSRYPLPFVKVGRCVRYRRRDLDAFRAARTVGTFSNRFHSRTRYAISRASVTAPGPDKKRISTPH
jgi:hypothetical protein